MKKVIALILALIMILSMGVVAFADGEQTPAGTITIKESEKDTVYNFYRIFDLIGDDTYDAIAYTLASKWTGFFTAPAAGAAYIADAQNTAGNLNPINVDGVIKYINITGENVVAFTNAAMQYAIDNNIAVDVTATGTGSDVEVGVDALGYYLMIPVDASTKTPNSSGSVASLNSTIPNAEILVKAIKPSIEKTDDKETVDVGTIVTYTITGKVPNTAGYSTYKYIITDIMTNGLTFKKDVVIKVGTEDITASCDIDYATDNKFVADIPVTELQDKVDQVITLTYTAVVNDNAVANAQDKNSATLDYGHNYDINEENNGLEKTPPVEEEVYTAKIVIDKHNAEGEKLANASFVLMNKDGKFYKYTAADANAGTDAKVEWVDGLTAPAADDYKVTDAIAKALGEAAAAGTITFKVTDTNGAAEFAGLADGTYYLVEYEAPAGYNRLANAQAVTVTGTDVDTDEAENKAQAGQQDFDVAVNSTADVLNQTGSVLPSTGGMGTTLFYVVGGALVVGAAVLLVTKKRMSNAE